MSHVAATQARLERDLDSVLSELSGLRSLRSKLFSYFSNSMDALKDRFSDELKASVRQVKASLYESMYTGFLSLMLSQPDLATSKRESQDCAPLCKSSQSITSESACSSEASTSNALPLDNTVPSISHSTVHPFRIQGRFLKPIPFLDVRGGGALGSLPGSRGRLLFLNRLKFPLIVKLNQCGFVVQ